MLRHASGSEIENWQGRRILDFHGNNAHHAGFGHPRIVEAITRQLQPLPFCTRLYTNARHVPPPDPRGCPFACGEECTLQCARYAAYVMEKEGDLGAVVVETVRASSRLAPPGYLEILREACDRHGALLIFDEIPHALGRTGRMFTCENYGVVPDMLVIGKALGGGVFPLAALIAREDLDGAMAAQALGHCTHEKDPVACAAGLALLDVIRDEDLCAKARDMGGYALAKMKEIAERHSLVGGVRGLGLLLGMDLALLDGSKAVEEAGQVMYACLERGLSFKTTMGSTLTLTPPLTITHEEMDRALSILEESINAVEQARGSGQ